MNSAPSLSRPTSPRWKPSSTLTGEHGWGASVTHSSPWFPACPRAPRWVHTGVCTCPFSRMCSYSVLRAPVCQALSSRHLHYLIGAPQQPLEGSAIVTSTLQTGEQGLGEVTCHRSYILCSLPCHSASLTCSFPALCQVPLAGLYLPHFLEQSREVTGSQGSGQGGLYPATGVVILQPFLFVCLFLLLK